MTIPTSPVWFITGCSTGFGRDLAQLVLDRGWPAVVTARGKTALLIWSKGMPTRWRST
jgi:NAD(P)-dependent dehydrogenase (short-subunit alcohol dehydrogenase family)